MKTFLYHIQVNAPLHDLPREYPEYRPGYYAVFFEDPDRLKVEVAHVPGITDRRM